MTMNWFAASGLAMSIILGFCSSMQAAKNEAAIARVGEDIRYLASDELEGRGPGTKGLQAAADYIRQRFEELGLQGGGEDGSFFRPFEINIGTKLTKDNSLLVLRGPQGQELKLKLAEQFSPLAVGGSGQAKGELVFAGYGISAPKLKYDDFQGVDVAGKVVVIIRKEPQQDDQESVFGGRRLTSHAYIESKLRAAKKAKAAGVLLVNDPWTTKEQQKDQLTSPDGFGSRRRRIPFAHIQQDVLNQILKQSPLESGSQKLDSLQAVAEQIDQTTQPISASLAGWSAELHCAFEPVQAEVSNVIGVLPGEGPLAEETIVIGAHYDHLGYGPFGSRRPEQRAIHNGADDNATGTAAVMELARRFAKREQKPARRLVFIAFTAEERGIIGSNHYLKNPTFPLEQTVAMINFDMIGHLGKKGLQLGGSKTAQQFPSILEQLTKGADLKVNLGGPLGGSDHSGFYRKKIPVLFFFTGLTDLYHTPEDDFETINVQGCVQTIDLAEQVVDAVLQLPERPVYQSRGGRTGPSRGGMAYLGVVPDYAAAGGDGLPLTDVNAESPAGQGGLKAGDVMIKIGDIEVSGIQELADGLRKYKPGQEVEIVVRRGDATQKVKVTLGEPRQRQ